MKRLVNLIDDGGVIFGAEVSLSLGAYQSCRERYLLPEVVMDVLGLNAPLILDLKSGEKFFALHPDKSVNIALTGRVNAYQDIINIDVLSII